MNRYSRAFCLCLGFVVLASAEAGDDSTEVVTVGFQDSQVRRLTLEELDQRRIWYEPAGHSAIRFRMEDAGEITNIVEELTYEILPPERSVNYVEPVLTEFLKRLDEANVPYEVVEYGDLDTQRGKNDGLPAAWVVWPEEHSARSPGFGTRWIRTPCGMTRQMSEVPANKALQADKDKQSCLLQSQKPRQLAFAAELGC